MTIRQLLRCWLAWLRCERGPAHPLPVNTDSNDLQEFWAEYDRETWARYIAWEAAQPDYLESLLARPTVTPDRSAYRRALPDAATVNDVATWLVYGESRDWWGHAHEACTAAVYWLAMRERVTGVRLK